jgi:PAS domain S-box-containing protein
MTKNHKQTGLGVVNDLSWGTHLCYFYESTHDLLATVIPYLKAGLGNGDYCVWFISESLSQAEARDALRAAVPDFDRHLSAGDIEIRSHADWLPAGPTSDLQKVMDAWRGRMDQALAKGYQGVRVVGHHGWGEKNDCKDRLAYEQALDESICEWRMTALCTYALNGSTATELLDALATHRSSLVQRHGRLEVVETSNSRKGTSAAERLNGASATGASEGATERALREAERKYREIFDNAGMGIFQTTLDGKTITANSALARMLGFESVADLIRERTDIASQHYVDPLRRAEFKQLLEAHESVRGFEFEGYRKDGRRIWLSDSVRAVRDEDGELLYYEGIAEDITERKRAEARSEAFAALAQKLSGARVPRDAAQIIADTAYELFGWDSCTLAHYDAKLDLVQSVLNIDTINGERVDVLPLSAPRKPTLISRQVISEGAQLILREEPYQFDPDMIPFGDKARPSVSTMAVPIRHGSEVIGILFLHSYLPKAYDRDALSNLQALADHCGGAMNRIRAEQALRESEERKRAILDAALDCIITMDHKGVIVDWNSAAERTFGHSGAVAVGSEMAELIIPARLREHHRPGLARFLATGEGPLLGHRLELNALRADGSEFPAELAISVIEAEGTPMFTAYLRDITDRKRDEEALRLSEDILGGAFDHAPIGMVVNAPDGRRLKVNRAFCEMLGYSEQELLQRHCLEVLHPDCKPEALENMHQLLSGTIDIERVETRYLHKAGHVVRANISSTVVHDDRGQPLYAVAQIEDITERKRAEEELKLFRSLVDKTGDAIEVLEPETLRFLDCNESACRALGYTRKELLSLTVFDIDPNVNESNLPGIEADLAKHGCAVFESLHRRKDGSTFPVEVNVQRVVLEREYRVAVIRDITERKQAEELLRQSESQLAEAQHVAQVGSWNWDMPSNILTWSDELYRIYGFEPQEFPLTFESFLGRLHPDDRSAVAQAVAECIENHEAFGFKERIIRPDGEVRVLQSCGNVIFDDNGNPTRLFGACQDITERTRTEAALLESEAGFRDLVENSREFICTHDLNGLILSANRAALEVLGYELSDLCGTKNYRDLLPPEVRDQFDDYLARIRRDGFASGLTLVQTKSGERRILEYHNTLRTEGVPTPVVRGMAHDITERRAAEKALMVSEQKYRDIFSFAPLGICQSLQDGTLITANKALATMLGYESVAELLQVKLDSDVYFFPRERHDLISTYEPRGYANDLEVQLKRKDGTPFWAQLNAHVVQGPGGATECFEAFVRDITERKHAEATLREAEERYRELFENARDPIYVHDLDGKYTSVNRAAERLTGHTREELLGRNFSDFIAPAYLKEVRENLCRKLGQDRETAYEVEVIAKDGRYIPVEVSSRLIYENDVAIGVQGTARDVTERRRAQEKLRTYARRLMQAQEAERQRIARELHDQIGQILTAAQINLHTVLRVCDTPEAADRVKESIRVLDEALDQVRDLSLDLRPSLLDDLGLVPALRWYAARQAQRTGVRVDVVTELHDHLRFPRELETAFFRIVQEALTNVARHAKASRVCVKLLRDQANLVLKIRDDGVGFDVNALRERAPSAATLGLQGMEERAHAVGGKFEIESSPLGGTEIRCRYPIGVNAEVTRIERMKAGSVS